MVKFYNTLFLLLICMFLPGKNIKQVGNTPAYDDIPDSLLTVGEIRKTVLSDPDKALYMLDVAEERKLLPTYQINWTRAQIYGSAKNMERVAVKWGKLVLEDDSVRNNTQYYFNMCKNLVESMIATGEYEEAIRYARSMIDVIDRAGKQKDNNHNSYWAIARVYRAMGNPEEAYKAMEEALQFCRQQIERKRGMGQPVVSNEMKLYLYYQNLSEWLCEDGKLEEALETVREMQACVERLRPLKGGAYPLQIPEKAFLSREGVVDGRLANLYVLLGQAGKGREWFAKMRENPLVDSDPEMIRLEIDYYEDMRLYGKLIEKALPLTDAALYEDSISVRRKEACLVLADAYLRSGKKEESVVYYKTALALTDSLNHRNNENHALEMATLLDTREKERQIELQVEELRWHRVVISVVAGVLALVGVIFILIVRHSRIVDRKNKLMAQQIDLYLSYRSELQVARERIRQLEDMEEEPVTFDVDGGIGNDREAEAVKVKPDDGGRKYFEELDLKIRGEQLFLNPDLTRDMILRLTPVGKNRISPLLQAFAGENFNGYINSLRLEYSLVLLKDFKNYTVEAVAIDSGFNNVRTYQRIFREKYGMTPAEYRKTLK
mgnify:FL=1